MITGETDKSAFDALVAARVTTVVATGLLLSDADLAHFTGRIRLVNLARRVPGFESIDSDNALGATLARRHLLGLGYIRIMHVGAPISDGYRGRRAGYSTTMRSAGLEPRILTADYSRAAATSTIGLVLDSAVWPTAVFAHNDQTALGVLDALHLLGLSAPEHLSVIGYDNTSASTPPSIDLTTIDLHARHLGHRAVEIAMGPPVSGEPVHESVDPSLVVRGSTACLTGRS